MGKQTLLIDVAFLSIIVTLALFTFGALAVEEFVRLL